MQRPPDVRITDLAEPRLSADVRAMMSAAVEMAGPVRFEEDWVLSRAVEETGLDDFGDDSFREPMRALFAAVEETAGLNAFGRVSLSMLMVQLAKNRLLVEDLVARHREILDVEIKAPIVIAGLQRTGTTHLHNLLSADPKLRHLPYWESLEPVLAARERPSAAEADPRLERCQMALDFQSQVMPHFERMHEMTVDHAHEEIQLLAIDYSTMLFDAMMFLPGWRRFYRSRDQTPHYRYLKRVLQVLTWLRGGDRWVLKSPQHIEQLGPLTATFPDATVVLTHRDPVSVIASTATMIAYGMRMSRDRVDLAAVGELWADITEQMLRSCLRDRAAVPADRSLDVLFHDYMRDDLAVVGSIYDLAGQLLGRESTAAIETYVEAHPRGRFGRVDYRLADFGLHAEELRERFAFYVDHFGLERESAAL